MKEYLAGTDPQNPGSVLKLGPVVVMPGGNVTISFEAVTNHVYAVEGVSALGSAWTTVTNVPAQPIARTVEVVVPTTGTTNRFFRLRVQ